MHFYCFKPSSLWYFVVEALRNSLNGSKHKKLTVNTIFLVLQYFGKIIFIIHLAFCFLNSFWTWIEIFLKDQSFGLGSCIFSYWDRICHCQIKEKNSPICNFTNPAISTAFGMILLGHNPSTVYTEWTLLITLKTRSYFHWFSYCIYCV